jgi:hypothetical protein
VTSISQSTKRVGSGVELGVGSGVELGVGDGVADGNGVLYSTKFTVNSQSYVGVGVGDINSLNVTPILQSMDGLNGGQMSGHSMLINLT